MLLDPSPRKVSIRPASRPCAARTVCRSASTWQGWNWSVSALITGTGLAAAISATRSWPNVRQTIAATWRPSTRAVSAIGSPRPSWDACASMTSGWPPSSAMPTANEILVRVDGLSNSTATVRGPASGRWPNRSAFIRSARSSTSACSAGLRSSSRRKCRVIAGPSPAVTACGEGTASRMAGSAARNAAAWSAARISGGASRTASGCTALTRKPACRAAASTAAADGLVSTAASHRPRPRTPASSGCRSPASPPASCWPTAAAWASRPLGLDRVQHGQRGGAGHRVAAERAAVVALAQRGPGVAEPDAGADRQPAAQPLGQGEHVRPDLLRLVREPGAGAPDAALDLVQHQQRARRVAGRAGRAQVAGRRRQHAALAQAGLQEHRRHVRAGRRPQRGGVAVGHEPNVKAEWAERLPDGTLAGQRQGAHGAAVEAALGGDEHRAGRALGAADQLDRGLVGLGAGVGEEHPAGRRRAASAAARPARSRPRAGTGWRCARACATCR